MPADDNLPTKSIEPKHPDEHHSATEVYAITGVEPEVQAYAMAKYSRSSLSLKQTLTEISQQKAEKFLNTFYFQYGHRSIADLAHIAIAVERLSLLAAIFLEDEQRWDGQERSTRYQDFSHPDCYIPTFAGDTQALNEYRSNIDFLFSEYRFVSGEMFRYLTERVPRPDTMKEDVYERTLRARAFDLARYILPLATNTSLGQITNARTLESQISRLLTSRYPEVRALGLKLKAAAKEPAYDMNADRRQELSDEIRGRDKMWWKNVSDLIEHEVRPAPTLVKYAEPNRYLAHARLELEAAAAQIMSDAPIAPAPKVDLLDDDPVEIEIAASLLYEHCNYPYRQIRERVLGLSASELRDLVDLGTKHRGSHDEILRPFCSGQKFRFDILMDVGGFRDMHRHRRCVQLHQDFTTIHGYDMPQEIAEAGLQSRYDGLMQRAATAIKGLSDSHPVAQDDSADRDICEGIYLMPLAYRKRTLFKMDFAEVVYITELRTGPAGHFSYRTVAYQMYEAVAERHPALAHYFRVHDVREPVDLLKR